MSMDIRQILNGSLLSNDEFLHFLGILLSMEVVEIHGPRRLYWSSGDGIFPGMKYGDIISYSRFEDITKNLQLLAMIPINNYSTSLKLPIHSLENQ